MNKNWTDAEINLMKANLDKTDKEIWLLLAKMGSRHSFLAVRKQRQRLSLKKKPGRPTKIKDGGNGKIVISWENSKEKFETPGTYSLNVPEEAKSVKIECWGSDNNKGVSPEGGDGGISE